MRRSLLIALAGFAAVLAAAVAILLRARGERTEEAVSEGTVSEGIVSERPLETMTRDELYELARERDVPGRSRMNKAELQAALQNGR